MGKPKEKALNARHFNKGSFKSKKFSSSEEGKGFAQSRKLKCFKRYGKFMKGKVKREVHIAPHGSEKGGKYTEKEFPNKKQVTNKLNDARQKFKKEKKEKEKEQKEREEAIRKHEKTVQKNIINRKKISSNLGKRTKKGQPIMANHMQFMLDKIQGTT